MYLISVEGYKNAGVHCLKIRKNWWNMGKHERLWKWSRCYKYIWFSFKRNKRHLFRIDAYFTKDFLAVETDEKGHTHRDLIFEEKRQKALEQ